MSVHLPLQWSSRADRHWWVIPSGLVADVKPELLLLPPRMSAALTHGLIGKFCGGFGLDEEDRNLINHRAVNDDVILMEMTNLGGVLIFLFSMEARHPFQTPPLSQAHGADLQSTINTFDYINQRSKCSFQRHK